MRDYECYYSAKIEEKWVKNDVIWCWAGIENYKQSYLLCINQWREPETEQYAEILVKVINQITPCWIEDGCIYYAIIKNCIYGVPDGYYDRNLILLNFVRYLWHNFAPNPTIFFETLKKSRYKDPFKRLSKANIANNQNYGESPLSWIKTPGHSNIDTKQKSIISLETFMNYEGNCTGFFNR